MLVLRCKEQAWLKIGNWGQLSLQPGFYLYVGSALGPGGLRARVLRHFRTKIPRHWHIDYLLSALELNQVWICCSPKRLEHDWALALAAQEGISQVPGFGCSDCSCGTHLFYSPRQPDSRPASAAMPCSVRCITALELQGRVWA